MNGNWVLKVYARPGTITKIQNVCGKNGLKRSGNCFTKGYVNRPTKELWKLRMMNVKCICYRVEFERATNYRKTFFNRTNGPYRCRYCNKKILKKDIVVDHIVPVAKTQKKASARFLLSLEGCSNVNDIRNLAPACRRCNSMKSDKMGLWIFRGWFGRYKVYWVFLYILRILLICGLFWLVYWFVSNMYV